MYYKKLKNNLLIMVSLKIEITKNPPRGRVISVKYSLTKNLRYGSTLKNLPMFLPLRHFLKIQQT